MKPKKQGETQHIPLPTGRRKMVSNPNEDHGLIYTKQENEEPEQEGRPIIDDTTVVTIKSGKPFPTWLYNNINAQYVQQIPNLINGFKLYVVGTTLEDYSDDTADLHYFDMKTSSKIKHAGIRKGGICQGSWEYPNPHCTFKALSVNNQPNRVSWLNVKGYKNLKICCRCMAKRQGCGARKFVDFNPWTNIALVYHMGTHTCTPQLETRRKKKRMAKILQNVDPQTKMSGKEMAVNQVEKMLETGTMEDVHNEADLWIDYRRNKQVMNDAVPSVPKDENSFDAVAIIKRKIDEYNLYYIYRVNNGLCNNTSDCVFKSSREMVQIAMVMDIDNAESNPLQLENCYFDAMHKSVQGFKSLELWTFHPTMKKILRLASMEICSENTRDIAQFFSLFNEILAKEKKIPGYKFNPRCFVCDEGGYNYNAITQVYGEDFCNMCVKGCQWHFKNDVVKKSTHIPIEFRDMFKDICCQLCVVTTVLKYNFLKGKLDELPKLAPALEKGIEWWHLHRSHIFGPFRMPGLPRVNLAEQGNSSWKPKKPLRLVHAVKNDTATMVLREEELYKFSRNMSMSTGRGSSDAICKARWRVEQFNIAKDFVEIFDDIEAVILEAEEVNEPTSYQPKQQASFKPPKDDESKKNFTTNKVPKSKKKTWSHEKSKRKEFDDVREVEERYNTPNVVEEDNMEDGEEVDENGDNEVCKHRIKHNRKRKECCVMCTKEDGKDKSGTKKKQSEDKDGKKKTKYI